MSGRGKWIVGLLLVASMAAGAQQLNHTSSGANPGAHAAFHAPGVQLPGAFVSQPGRLSQPGQAVFAPGQAVFTPGQSVFPPGQSVFTPGQSIFPSGQTVFPAGQEVFPPGNRVFPAPNVLTPFHSASPTAMRRGGGRHHERDWDHDHDRYHYRHRDGGGYAVPYLFGSGYWLTSGDLGYTGDSEETQISGAAASDLQSASSVAAQPVVPAPPSEDTYRPAYHAAASAPNVIQSEEPKLTVVMKDGTHKTMRNYALTPTMLIDLDAAATGREMNIPLEQVNVTATQKAAAREGLNFSVPKGG